MKRDPRLHALSRDHHHALVLARRASRGDIDAETMRASFDAELAPHFAVEERVLLPALREAGGATLALAERTLSDHEAMRAAVARGDVAELARLLEAHVRFEEREVFPACEALLPSSVLDALARAVA